MHCHENLITYKASVLEDYLQSMHAHGEFEHSLFFINSPDFLSAFWFDVHGSVVI